MPRTSNGRALRIYRNRRRMRRFGERAPVCPKPHQYAYDLATKRSEDEDLTDLMMDHDPRPDYGRSPTQLMPPPRGPMFHSPFASHSSGSPVWNFDSSSPNGFSMSSPLNPSPKSDPNSPMHLQNILCASAPGVQMPLQYETDKRDSVMPIIEETKPVTKTPPPVEPLPPMWHEIIFHPSDESGDDEEVEEIPRHEDSELLRSPKRRRLNSGMSFDVYNLHLPHDELRMWDFYDTVTCKILSCKNAAGENPWRDDLIVRARQSDPLKHALFALTRFHMKRHLPGEAWQMANLGLNHTNSSFQALHKVMNEGLAFDENNIAAMLVLSFSQGIPYMHCTDCRSGMTHD